MSANEGKKEGKFLKKVIKKTMIKQKYQTTTEPFQLTRLLETFLKMLYDRNNLFLKVDIFLQKPSDELLPEFNHI